MSPNVTMDVPRSLSVLAAAREIGVLLAVLILIGVLLYFVFRFGGRIMTLYADALDANMKLSQSIDNLSDKTTTSNEKLQNFLSASFKELGKDLSDFGEIVMDHDRRLEDHEVRIGGLESTKKEEGREILQ